MYMYAQSLFTNVSTWTWRSTISIAVKFRDKRNLWSEISYSGRGQFLLTFHSSHLMKIVPGKIFAQSYNWIQCRLQKWGCKQSNRKHSFMQLLFYSPDVLVFLLLFLSLLLMSWQVLHVFFFCQTLVVKMLHEHQMFRLPESIHNHKCPSLHKQPRSQDVI